MYRSICYMFDILSFPILANYLLSVALHRINSALPFLKPKQAPSIQTIRLDLWLTLRD
jgi:hypothetical protein